MEIPYNYHEIEYNLYLRILSHKQKNKGIDAFQANIPPSVKNINN